MPALPQVSGSEEVNVSRCVMQKENVSKAVSPCDFTFRPLVSLVEPHI